MHSRNIAPGTKTEDWSPDLKRKWVDSIRCQSDSEGNTFNHPLNIRENKARWMFWASLWPMSMAVYIFWDMLINVFNKIYKMCAGFLQDWANAHYANSSAAKDLKRDDE